MKKRLLIFVTTLALVLAMAMPALAEQSWYGRYGEAGNTEELQNVSALSNEIYDRFGVDAIYIVDDEATGDSSAKNYYLSVEDELMGQINNNKNYIIYTCSADDAYIVVNGSCADLYDTSEKRMAFFDICEDYEYAGQYGQAATKFLATVLSDFNAGETGAQPNDANDVNKLIASNPDSAYHYVVDEAGLLNDDEKTKLEEKLSEISERQQFDVVVVTTKDLQGKTAEAYADDYFDYNGYGYGASHDGCLLLFDMGNRYMHLSTTGYGITALTDAGIDYINDEIYLYARNDDWAGAFNSYANNVDKFVSQAKSGKPYDVGNMPRAKKTAGEVLKGVAISLVIGLIVGFIAMKKVKGDYEKAVRYKASASDYLVSGSLQVTGAYDNFMYNNVTSRRIETESSSGGSSTHTGSSGTSHGGGGRSF